jgi:nucleoid DNA-binding protein
LANDWGAQYLLESLLDLEGENVVCIAPSGRLQLKIQLPRDKPMTKRDLVIQISEETGLNQQTVLHVVQRTLDLISESVAAGNTVELRNFGVFEVKVRKARVGRNPNRPDKDVPIPQRMIAKFKPGKEMREAVMRLSPSQKSKS